MAKQKVEIELDFDKWGRDFWIFDPEDGGSFSSNSYPGPDSGFRPEAIARWMIFRNPDWRCTRRWSRAVSPLEDSRWMERQAPDGIQCSLRRGHDGNCMLEMREGGMSYKNDDFYRGRTSRPIRYYQERTVEAMPPPMTEEESAEAEDSMERIARRRFVRRYERRLMVLIIRALLAEIRRLEAELAKFQPCDLTDYKRDGLDYPMHQRTVYHREGER